MSSTTRAAPPPPPRGGTYHHLDVTDEAAWKAVVGDIVAQHGPISVLIINTGIYLSGRISEMDLDDYRRVIDVNQIGVFLGMKTVAVMAEAGTGSIINISSVAGLRGQQGSVAYGASKFAVRGMTKVAAREFARFGVRVNSIHPAPLRRPCCIRSPAWKRIPERALRGIALRRIAERSRVARMALCSLPTKPATRPARSSSSTAASWPDDTALPLSCARVACRLRAILSRRRCTMPGRLTEKSL